MRKIWLSIILAQVLIVSGCGAAPKSKSTTYLLLPGATFPIGKIPFTWEIPGAEIDITSQKTIEIRVTEALVTGVKYKEDPEFSPFIVGEFDYTIIYGKGTPYRKHTTTKTNTDAKLFIQNGRLGLSGQLNLETAKTIEKKKDPMPALLLPKSVYENSSAECKANTLPAGFYQVRERLPFVEIAARTDEATTHSFINIVGIFPNHCDMDDIVHTEK